MAEFYSYQKKRREFGKPCKFTDTKVITFQHFAEEEVRNDKEQKYVVRNPNFIQIDNITELADHFVNTQRVSTGDKGMYHKEGGWRADTDPTEPQQYQKFMKKIDKDPSLAAAMKSIADIVKPCMNQNNYIDPFEEYFADEQMQHQVENISTKTLMLLKDPPDICKRGVSKVSWYAEGSSKIAVSYAISRFQQTPDKMRTNAYIWDTFNPNSPDITLNSPSPVTNISYNHKLNDIVGGGCANGLVAVWDAKKGKDPVIISQVQKSHHDPVTHFQWLITKTGQECVSISTDGYAHFWDTRKMQHQPTESLSIVEILPDGKQALIGGTSLQNSAQMATKFLIGTEQGTLIVANKKPKKVPPVQISLRLGFDNRHLGPIYSISRNMQYPKVFMTVGDWSAKIWLDDIKTPLVRTKYHASYLTDGCFSPTRIGAFFLTRKDGWLDVWDYYYRQNQIAFSHKVSQSALTCIKISYTGTGNQITGGKLAAIGDQQGTVTILELSQSLYSMQKRQRDIMNEMFTREANKEKLLEQIRKTSEKKQQPKDQTAAKAKFQQRKNELIKEVDQKFAKLMKTIESGDAHMPGEHEEQK